MRSIITQRTTCNSAILSFFLILYTFICTTSQHIVDDVGNFTHYKKIRKTRVYTEDTREKQYADTSKSEELQRNGIDFIRECIDPLQIADTNNDQLLSNAEYVTFVDYLSSDILYPDFIDTPSFSDLPLPFVNNIFDLANDVCVRVFQLDSSTDVSTICGKPDNALDVTGIYQSDTDNINSIRKFYLYHICSNTKILINEYAPSAEPSAQPSLSRAPTISPGESATAEAPFMLSNTMGRNALDIMSSDRRRDIVNALRAVAVDVLVDVNAALAAAATRGLRLRGSSPGRRLTGTVNLEDAYLETMTDETCPSYVQDATARCQNVEGRVTVRVIDTDVTTAIALIEGGIQSGLGQNDLLRRIGFVMAPNPVVAPPGPVPTPTAVTEPAPSPTIRDMAPTTPVTLESGKLPTGAIAGIASGAVALGLFAGIALFINNQRQRGSKLRANNIESTFVTSNRLIEEGRGFGNLGAKAQNGKKRVQVSEFSSLSDGEDHDSSIFRADDPKGRTESSMDSSMESSSNAGSSGWSSSAGMSSLNTASVDSLEHGFVGVTSLARIGKESSIHSKYGGPYVIGDDGDGSNKSYHSDPLEDTTRNRSHLSRLELNNAIEAGNWAAVGATAALLASSESTSASKSLTSNSQSTLTSHERDSRSGGNSVDRARYAELDQLVAASDWEGVVLAAAKYEFESTGGSTNGSISTAGSSSKRGPAGDDSSYASANVSSIGDTSGSYASASEGLNRSNLSLNSNRTDSRSLGSMSGKSSIGTGAGSDSPRKIQRRAEIRLEVEELVRRVVPEEVDNVDEMMRQFRGREEELVETLRTMQERSIAQREREEMRRNAKREARKSVMKSGKTFQGSGGGELGKSLHGSLHGTGARTGLPPVGPRIGGKKNAGPAATTVTGIGVAAAGTAHRKGEADNNQSTNSSASDLSPNGLQQKQSGTDTSKSSPSDTTTASSKMSYNDRIEIERAIEEGDWDAVGAAAIKMGGSSVFSAGENDFASLDSSTIGSDDRESLTSGSKLSSTIGTSHRATELEKLIEKGDWTGVVAAAGSFSAADRHSLGSPHADQGIPTQVKSGSTSGSSSSWRNLFFSGESKIPFGSTNSIPTSSETDALKGRKTSQEEQDALAQADVWSKIARQSKDRGASGAKGASDAADWAISRSLTALQNADQQTTPKTTITKGNPILNESRPMVNPVIASSRRRNQRRKNGGSRSPRSSDGESF